jgi:GWxTD domain-containing protein
MGARWQAVFPSLICLLLSAPTASSGQTLAEAQRLLARRDTTGAIEIYQRLITADERNAEAHYQVGLLYMSRHVPGSRLSPNRRKAEEHFRYATRFEGDSAKYWLALADLFRGEDNSFTRSQVSGLVNRALEAAERAGPTPAASDVSYRAARVNWERWEAYGRRYLFNSSYSGLDANLFSEEWRYVEQFFAERVRADPSSPGEQYLMDAERHSRDALASRPGQIDAAGLLVVALGENDRWPEAAGVTRRLIRTVPDSGRAWALHGLALARDERWVEAQEAFDTAFALMADDERVPYQDLGQILRSTDEKWYQATTDVQRAFLDTLYWRAAQPLTLTGKNELRAEFYARVTYVLHRWTDPLRGYRGHETDRGSVYIRYGPPSTWAVFNRSTMAWVYPRARMRFLFSVMPGFARAHFMGSSREDARSAKTAMPARFDNVPIVHNLDTILVQVAQFRATDPAATEIGIFSFIPVGRIAETAAVVDFPLITAAVVQDTLGNDVHRVERQEIMRGGTPQQQQQRTWRMTLTPRSYYLRMEAYVAALARGARSTEMLDVRRFDTSRLMLSDVLLAERVAPQDSNYARWSDFFIEPSAGRLGPNDSLGLLWEIYNLRPDSAGVAHYSVELRVTVESIERPSTLAHIFGSIADAMGITPLGDDRVSMSYSQNADAEPGGTVVEYLVIDLRDAPKGTYTIEVIISDEISGQWTAGQRTLTVTDTPLTRGGR